MTEADLQEIGKAIADHTGLNALDDDDQKALLALKQKEFVKLRILERLNTIIRDDVRRRVAVLFLGELELRLQEAPGIGVKQHINDISAQKKTEFQVLLGDVHSSENALRKGRGLKAIIEAVARSRTEEWNSNPKNRGKTRPPDWDGELVKKILATLGPFSDSLDRLESSGTAFVEENELRSDAQAVLAATSSLDLKWKTPIENYVQTKIDSMPKGISITNREGARAVDVSPLSEDGYQTEMKADQKDTTVVTTNFVGFEGLLNTAQTSVDTTGNISNAETQFVRYTESAPLPPAEQAPSPATSSRESETRSESSEIAPEQRNSMVELLRTEDPYTALEKRISDLRKFTPKDKQKKAKLTEWLSLSRERIERDLGVAKRGLDSEISQEELTEILSLLEELRKTFATLGPSNNLKYAVEAIDELFAYFQKKKMTKIPPPPPRPGEDGRDSPESGAAALAIGAAEAAQGSVTGQDSGGNAAGMDDASLGQEGSEKLPRDTFETLVHQVAVRRDMNTSEEFARIREELLPFWDGCLKVQQAAELLEAENFPLSREETLDLIQTLEGYKAEVSLYFPGGDENSGPVSLYLEGQIRAIRQKMPESREESAREEHGPLHTPAPPASTDGNNEASGDAAAAGASQHDERETTVPEVVYSAAEAFNALRVGNTLVVTHKFGKGKIKSGVGDLWNVEAILKEDDDVLKTGKRIKIKKKIGSEEDVLIIGERLFKSYFKTAEVGNKINDPVPDPVTFTPNRSEVGDGAPLTPEEQMLHVFIEDCYTHSAKGGNPSEKLKKEYVDALRPLELDIDAFYANFLRRVSSREAADAARALIEKLETIPVPLGLYAKKFVRERTDTYIAECEIFKTEPAPKDVPQPLSEDMDRGKDDREFFENLKVEDVVRPKENCTIGSNQFHRSEEWKVVEIEKDFFEDFVVIERVDGKKVKLKPREVASFEKMKQSVHPVEQEDEASTSERNEAGIEMYEPARLEDLGKYFELEVRKQFKNGSGNDSSEFKKGEKWIVFHVEHRNKISNDYVQLKRRKDSYDYVHVWAEDLHHFTVTKNFSDSDIDLSKLSGPISINAETDSVLRWTNNDEFQEAFIFLSAYLGGFVENLRTMNSREYMRENRYNEKMVLPLCVGEISEADCRRAMDDVLGRMLREGKKEVESLQQTVVEGLRVLKMRGMISYPGRPWFPWLWSQWNKDKKRFRSMFSRGQSINNFYVFLKEVNFNFTPSVTTEEKKEEDSIDVEELPVQLEAEDHDSGLVEESAETMAAEEEDADTPRSPNSPPPPLAPGAAATRTIGGSEQDSGGDGLRIDASDFPDSPGEGGPSDVEAAEIEKLSKGDLLTPLQDSLILNWTEFKTSERWKVVDVFRDPDVKGVEIKREGDNERCWLSSADVRKFRIVQRATAPSPPSSTEAESAGRIREDARREVVRIFARDCYQQINQPSITDKEKDKFEKELYTFADEMMMFEVLLHAKQREKARVQCTGLLEKFKKISNPQLRRVAEKILQETLEFFLREHAESASADSETRNAQDQSENRAEAPAASVEIDKLKVEDILEVLEDIPWKDQEPFSTGEQWKVEQLVGGDKKRVGLRKKGGGGKRRWVGEEKLKKFKLVTQPVASTAAPEGTREKKPKPEVLKENLLQVASERGISARALVDVVDGKRCSYTTREYPLDSESLSSGTCCVVQRISEDAVVLELLNGPEIVIKDAASVRALRVLTATEGPFFHGDVLRAGDTIVLRGTAEARNMTDDKQDDLQDGVIYTIARFTNKHCFVRARGKEYRILLVDLQQCARSSVRTPPLPLAESETERVRGVRPEAERESDAPEFGHAEEGTQEENESDDFEWRNVVEYQLLRDALTKYLFSVTRRIQAANYSALKFERITESDCKSVIERLLAERSSVESPRLLVGEAVCSLQEQGKILKNTSWLHSMKLFMWDRDPITFEKIFKSPKSCIAMLRDSFERVPERFSQKEKLLFRPKPRVKPEGRVPAPRDRSVDRGVQVPENSSPEDASTRSESAAEEFERLRLAAQERARRRGKL